MNTDQIPQTLKERAQWVAWSFKADPAHPDKKPRKIPRNPHDGSYAATNTPATWGTFAEALTIAKKRRWAGVGYVFAEGDNFVGVDLDNCRDPQTGAFAEWAREWVGMLLRVGYVEVSPSGCGVKAIVIGSIAKSHKVPTVDGGAVEIYNRVRFFTVTGERLSNSQAEPLDGQSVIDDMIAHFDPPPAATPAPREYTPPALPSAASGSWLDKQRFAVEMEWRRWVTGKVDHAVMTVQNAPAGLKHTKRLAMGKLLGGVVALRPDLLNANQALELLYDAQRPSSHDAQERKAIHDGILFGVPEPLDAPRVPTDRAIIVENDTPYCPECDTKVLRSRPDIHYPGTETNGWYCPKCRFPMMWPVEAYVPTDGTTTTAQVSQSAVVGDSWLEDGATLAQLQVTEFAPLRWIVAGILPEGATVLAAKQKMKKSWLALNLGLSVANGQKAIGALKTDQGRVLFLDLEGNQRRVKSRTEAILGSGDDWPDCFHVFTTWPRGEEGITRLERWMAIYPDTKLIVIDLLAEFRPPADPREDRYQYDRTTLVNLNRFAERHGCAVIIIHHTRKSKGDDVFEEISGTIGLTGAVSASWVMTRAEKNTVLNIQGRDIKNDDPITLEWDGFNCTFSIAADAVAPLTESGDKQAILRVMADGGVYAPRTIAAELGKATNNVQQMLLQMREAGLVEKIRHGEWAIVEQKKPINSPITDERLASLLWRYEQLAGTPWRGLSDANAIARAITKLEQ